MMLGADVGGTFTDLVLVAHGEVRTAKIPTSQHQEEAIAEGIDELSGDASVDVFVHGTTVATNALLERINGSISAVCRLSGMKSQYIINGT